MRTAVSILLLFLAVVSVYSQDAAKENADENEIRLLLKKAVSKNDIGTFEKFLSELSGTDSVTKQRIIYSEEVFDNILSFTDSVFHSPD